MSIGYSSTARAALKNIKRLITYPFFVSFAPPSHFLFSHLYSHHGLCSNFDSPPGSGAGCPDSLSNAQPKSRPDLRP